MPVHMRRGGGPVAPRSSSTSARAHRSAVGIPAANPASCRASDPPSARRLRRCRARPARRPPRGSTCGSARRPYAGTIRAARRRRRDRPPARQDPLVGVPARRRAGRRAPRLRAAMLPNRMAPPQISPATPSRSRASIKRRIERPASLGRSAFAGRRPPAPACAASRACCQLPKSAPTTLADGQSPSLSRSRAGAARRFAWVRDQSYEDGSRPYLCRHSSIAASTSCLVHFGWAAPGLHRLQYRYASPLPLRGCV
jgi:hypothetical protein